ncbi:MAG: hypothetical protein K6G40_07450, partial [Eubacterium sp.]|nr:hypothetical protein [Eubacterium sp.]
VIPNHNMDEAPDIAKLLSGLKCVHRVDIIPFHKFGGGKYSQLGRVYEIYEDTLTKEAQDTLVKMFEERGLKVQLGG